MVHTAFPLQLMHGMKNRYFKILRDVFNRTSKMTKHPLQIKQHNYGLTINLEEFTEESFSPSLKTTHNLHTMTSSAYTCKSQCVGTMIKVAQCGTHIQHSQAIQRGQITSQLGLRTWVTLILWKIQTFLIAKIPITPMLSCKI